MIESSSLYVTRHCKVQDLSIYGKIVMLDIKIYEFNYVNLECSIISFTKTFEKFFNNYNFMIERQLDLMTSLAFETSCESCTRILKTMKKTSGDTVIHHTN